MSRRPLASTRGRDAVSERVPPRRRHTSGQLRAPEKASAPRVEPRPRRRATIVTAITLGAILLVSTLAFGGRWLLHQSYFAVQHVALTGEVHETSAQILASTHLDTHPAMIDLSQATVQRELSLFPWIGSVSLIKRWPNSVSLAVHEVAAVAVAFDPRHVLRYVSASGRDLGPAPLTAVRPTLVTTPATLQTRVWPFQGSEVAAAIVASQLPMAFGSQVREIIVDAHGNVTLQLTTPLRFFLGPPTNLNAKFVAVASALAHATFVAGDLVDVTAPSELSVTGPSPP